MRPSSSIYSSLDLNCWWWEEEEEEDGLVGRVGGKGEGVEYERVGGIGHGVFR